MKKLTNWTARRAGGRMTITGTDPETQTLQRVTNVDVISSSDGRNPVAVDKNGDRYELA